MKERLNVSNKLKNTVGGILFILIALIACKPEVAKHDKYVCPMHPAVITEKPGLCPICGMDLVRQGRTAEDVAIDADLAKLIKSPNEAIVSSIKLIKGQYKAMPRSIFAQGVINYDTRNLSVISAKVAGRLEKTYVKYVFEPVYAGQKIAELYSPELLQVQRELLLLLADDANNQSLIDAAKQKLQLLGLADHQIDNFIKKKEASTLISIYSPVDGYVVSQDSDASQRDNAALTSDTQSTMTGTSSAVNTNSEGTSINSVTREGSYVKSGDVLFRIVDGRTLRVDLSLPALQMENLRKGDKIELDFEDDRHENATIDFVQPFYSKGEKFVKIRVYDFNTEGLHVGHIVKSRILLPQMESFWVPREAVIDLGINKVVFIKDRDVFAARKVITGETSDGEVEIKVGVSSTDEIASNAQYLVDSEGFIKVGK